MLNSDFSQDRIAVIGHDDASHRVHQHLEHGLGAEAGSNDIADGFTGRDVLSLHLATVAALSVLAQDQHGTGGISKHLEKKMAAIKKGPDETFKRIEEV